MSKYPLQFAMVIMARGAIFSVAHGAVEWRLDAILQPPPAEVAAMKPTRLPVYGIYSWADEYLAHRDFIREVGWKHTRLSGPVTDEVMRAYAEDGTEIMLTVAVRRPMERSPDKPSRQWRNRATYPTDEAFRLERCLRSGRKSGAAPIIKHLI